MHAPGVPTYELHTLGWRAFQDLSATVLREVWGQTVQSFADTQDGGRDGAFYGIWHGTAENKEVPEGLAHQAWTVQFLRSHEQCPRHGYV